MLASVLHSEVTINVSISIMRAFVEMRRFISNNALLFERISIVELRQLEYHKQTKLTKADVKNFNTQYDLHRCRHMSCQDNLSAPPSNILIKRPNYKGSCKYL